MSGGSSPPFGALPGSSEFFFASSAKFAARLQLLFNVLGLLARRVYTRLVNLAVRSRRWRLNQDVAHGHRLGNAIRILVLVVILLQLSLRHRNLVGQLRGLDHDVLCFDLFRNRVRVLLLVLLVESLQFGIGRLDLLLDVIEGQHRVLEFDLGVLLPHFFGNVLVADGDGSGDKGEQFPLGDLGLHLLLELRHAQVELALDKRLVGLFADKVAPGKQRLSHLALM